MRLTILWALSVCMPLFVTVGVSEAWADKRVALVIATSKYQNFEAATLPSQTVRRIAHGLRSHGVTVIESHNERSAVIRARLTRFAKRVQKAEIAIVLLAGHMVSGRGFVFYLPNETRADTANEMRLRGIPARAFVAAAGRAKQGLVIALPTPPTTSTIGGAYVPQIQSKPKPGKNVTVAFSANDSLSGGEIESAAVLAAENLLGVLNQKSPTADNLVGAVARPPNGLVVGRGRSNFTLASETETTKVTATTTASGAGVQPNKAIAAAEAKQAAEAAERQRELDGLRAQLKGLRASLARAEAAKAAAGQEREKAERKAEQAASLASKAETRARAAETKLQDAQRALEENTTKARVARRTSDRTLDELRNQAAAARQKLGVAESELAELRKRAGRQSRLEAEVKAAGQARKRAEQELDEVRLRLKQAIGRAEAAEKQQSLAKLKRPDPTVATKPETALKPVTAAPTQTQQPVKPSSVQPALPKAPRQLQSSALKVASLKKLENQLTPEQKRRIQEFLRSKGFLDGRPSDRFDQGVRAAIKKYQSALNADVTGYLTPRQLLTVLKQQ